MWVTGGFLSGIIYVNRGGLMWKYAPVAYGPPKTIYNRWKRWSRMGVFAGMLLELAAQDQDTETNIIDATHFKAHCTAASLRVKKGAPATSVAASSAAQRAG